MCPQVLDTSLDSGYRAMAADKVRETEAQEWGNALAVEDAIRVQLGMAR